MLLTFAPMASADPVSINVKLKKEDGNSAKPNALDKNLQSLKGFKFNCERQASDNAVVVSLKIPGDAATGWQQFCQSCHNSALYVGKNATALGRWLDSSLKPPYHIDNSPSFVTPIVTSASKYCSRFRSGQSSDGRVKTIAER